MKRIMLPIALILVLGALLLSPVSAYTLDDDVCAGLESSTYAFDFSVVPDSVGAYAGNPTITFNETVDTTYHYGINNTAWLYGGYGGEDDGIQITFSNLDNSSYGFNITSIYFDFYNYTFSELSLIEILLIYRDYENDIEYALLYAPDFDILNNSGDYDNLKFVSNQYSYWWRVNITTLEEIDNRWTNLSYTRDWELQNFDLIFLNIPPDYKQYEDWNVEFVIDNMVVAQEENEYMTTDCSLIFESFDEIKMRTIEYYATFPVVAVVGEYGVQNYMSYYESILPSYSHDLAITVVMSSDGQTMTNGQNSLLIFYDYFVLNDSGIIPIDMVGKEINITCDLTIYNDIDPFEILCWIQNIEIIGDFDLTTLSDDIINANDEDVYTGFSIIKDRYSDYSFDYQRYHTRYNETHFVLVNLPNYDIVYIRPYNHYVGSLESDESLVNESWNYIGNFSVFSYSIYLPEIDDSAIIYSSDRLLDLENYEGNDIIILGYGAKEYYYGVDPYSNMDYVEGSGSVSMINIIGNDLCEELESSIPSAWNYDPQCEYDVYGLTGYAITQTNLELVGIGFLIILIGFLYLFLSTFGEMDIREFGIIVGGLLILIIFYVAVMSIFPSP